MQLVLNLPKLEKYARQKLPSGSRLSTLRVTQLAGSFTAYGLYRHDLLFEGADGIQEVSFVQKFTHPAEVRVVQVLAALPAAKTFPELIDFAWEEAGEDKFTHWYLIPFYPGATLTFEDEVPPDIIQALAQLHVHFQGQEERFNYLHRVDAAFFRGIFDNALEIVERAWREKPHPSFDEAQRELLAARGNGQLYKLLSSLPVTLTHGDVHPGNIIQLPDGPAVLVDWGNARIAPAMLDIANLIELESESWHQYLAAWAEANGAPMEDHLAYLSYHWATIMVNSQYLPYAVDFTPVEHVARMVAKIVEAQDKITKHLRNG